MGREKEDVESMDSLAILVRAMTPVLLLPSYY